MLIILNGPSPPPRGSLLMPPNIFSQNRGRLQDCFCPYYLDLIPQCLENSTSQGFTNPSQGSHELSQAYPAELSFPPHSLLANHCASTHFPSITYFLLLQAAAQRPPSGPDFPRIPPGRASRLCLSVEGLVSSLSAPGKLKCIKSLASADCGWTSAS